MPGRNRLSDEHRKSKTRIRNSQLGTRNSQLIHLAYSTDRTSRISVTLISPG